jgi:tripartite-type tricarboxylate transporter receptor subunit TctC
MPLSILYSAIVVLASALLCSQAVHAQTYPSKPIRLIVPFAPGGVTDSPWRVVAPKLGEALGQSIILDNRPGRGGTIGAAAAAKAPSDGYTLLGTSVSHVISGVFLKNLDYDAIEDFLYIGQIGATKQVLLVHPSLPATSVREFIALARGKPGQLDFGSSGAGGASHLSFLLFASVAKLDLMHIPYKTVHLMMADLVAGRIPTAIIGVPVAVPFVTSKRLRALSVSAKTRSQFLPDVPTLEESGVIGAEAIQVSGLLAPRKMPAEAARKLEMQLEKIVAQPDVRSALAATGTEPQFASSSAFSLLMSSEAAKWSRLITEKKITTAE